MARPVALCLLCRSAPVRPGRGSRYCEACAKLCRLCKRNPKAPYSRSYCGECETLRGTVSATRRSEIGKKRDSLRRTLNWQIKKGVRQKEPCYVCGRDDQVWLYLPELSIEAAVFLCPLHHREMIRQTGRYNGYQQVGRRKGSNKKVQTKQHEQLRQQIEARRAARTS